MDLSEKKIDSELKYSGVIVNVMLDHAELCDGSIVKREVVEHPGGVTVLPIDDDGFCYCVRQFRYPLGKVMLEAPAGKLEKGVSVPSESCRRKRDFPQMSLLISDRAALLRAFPPRFCISILRRGSMPAKAIPTRESF